MSAQYTLVIGNKNYSSWSMRPWLWMRHHNIAFETHRIPLYASTTRDEISSFGTGTTVPILIDGEIKLWDSLSILEYLAEQHPEHNGWPADPAVRAHARSVSAEMHSGFAALRSSMPMNCRYRVTEFEVEDDVQRAIDRIDHLFADCRRRFSGDGEWLFGDFSIADAMFAPVVMRFNSYGVKLTGKSAEYIQSVNMLPAVLEWIKDSHNEKEVIEFE